MSYEIKTGDIWESGADTFVIPVNCVGVAGKGLALEWKKRYPEAASIYADDAHAHRLSLGSIYCPGDTNPLFLCFPTKGHWQEKSKLGDIFLGLGMLMQMVLNLAAQGWPIRMIAVPALGCGLGGLNWLSVGPLIIAAVETLPDKHWLIYPPQGER